MKTKIKRIIQILKTIFKIINEYKIFILLMIYFIIITLQSLNTNPF